MLSFFSRVHNLKYLSILFCVQIDTQERTNV